MTEYRAEQMRPTDISALMRMFAQRLERGESRNDGSVITYVLRRTGVTHEETQARAHELYLERVRRGAPTDDPSRMDSDYTLAREQLLSEPVGYVRLLTGRAFIGIVDISTSLKGAETAGALRALVNRALSYTKNLLAQGYEFRSLVLPWTDPSLRRVLPDGWCSITSLEAGCICFYPNNVIEKMQL